MKYLQSYNNFQVNEKLSKSEIRSIPYVPIALISFLFKSKIYPMLNLRWNELKKSTKKSNFSSIFGGGSTSKIEQELTEIKLGDIPSNKLKIPMFLRNWKVYSVNSHRTQSENRKVIYISKDKLKMGDMCKFERLTDRDIYPSFKNGKPENFEEIPVIIMVAKFDKAEKCREMEQYINDICLELVDELHVEIKPYFNIHGDKATITIKVPDHKKLIFNDKTKSIFTETAESIKSYIKSEKINLDYKIYYTVKPPFYYIGNAGRFGTEIIPAAKEYSDRHDTDMWHKYHKSLMVSKLSDTLTGEDLDVLLKDINNCTSSQTLITDIENRRKQTNVYGWTLSEEEIFQKYKITEIRLSSIKIVFDKK